MNEEVTYKSRLGDLGHRNYVGGECVESWYGIGKLQYHYLVANGLKSSDTFLDVACGSLRLGQYLIPMLDEGNYFGLDGNSDLIKLGKKEELYFDLIENKSPCFASNYAFDFSFMGGRKFDFAIAQSLFTHLTMRDIEVCFKNIPLVMNKGGSKFYFTFFEGDSKENPSIESDPHEGWFYSFDELKAVAKRFSLNLEYIGGWEHPRNQKLVLCTYG